MTNYTSAAQLVISHIVIPSSVRWLQSKSLIRNYRFCFKNNNNNNKTPTPLTQVGRGEPGRLCPRSPLGSRTWAHLAKSVPKPPPDSGFAQKLSNFPLCHRTSQPGGELLPHGPSESLRCRGAACRRSLTHAAGRRGRICCQG